MPADARHQIWIAATKDFIKVLKTALEASNIFDKPCGIRKVVGNTEKCYIALDGQTLLSAYHSLIPTTTGLESCTGNNVPAILREALAQVLTADSQKCALFVAKEPTRESTESEHSSNPVARAVQLWLEQLDKYTYHEIQYLIQTESWSYQICHPLLLLGPSSFGSEAWHTVSSDKTVSEELPSLHKMMCSATNCTHLAINGRIPLDIKSNASQDMAPNLLRSPSCLVPLYGDFGSQKDEASSVMFEKTLWALATQNSIHQVFAPMHTMFSRGNVKEKARVLRLAQTETEPYSAVDLYAGIGYFAFSYAKGGASVVLGWDINDWSVEGFRRGAAKNTWDVKVYKQGESESETLRSWLNSRDDNGSQAPKLVIFVGTNEGAPRQVKDLRMVIPPVRHVNCGYLPSSSDSWSIAVQCLDPIRGGYIHAHENVRPELIEARRIQIVDAFVLLLEKQFGKEVMFVDCKHVERVKSYAPGVLHCVFDVDICQNTNKL